MGNCGLAETLSGLGEFLQNNKKEKQQKLTVPKALAFIKRYKEPNFPKPHYMSPVEFALNHKHVNYCEALIDEKGRIAYAIPSHNLAVFGNATTKVLYELKTPVVDYSIEGIASDFKKVLIWYDYAIIGFRLPTPQQVMSLYMLYTSGCVSEECWNVFNKRIAEQRNQRIKLETDVRPAWLTDVLQGYVKGTE